MSILRIQAFTFLDFMQEVQNAVIAGYRLDFESNDNCPQRFGNTYEAGMLKQEDVIVEQVLTDEEPAEVKQEEPKAKTASRPKKGST